MRRYLVLGLVVLGAAAGFGASFTQSTLYASTSTLMVMPARVPESFVPGQVPPITPTRIAALRQQLLSRTRLERMMKEFSLYTAEAQTMEDEDLVAMMRDRIVVELDGDAVRVGFVDANPRLAMRVSERFASLMVEESLRDREMQAENTNQFLESQMYETRRQLDEKHAELAARRRQGTVPRSIELDVEVLETRYRGLSAMSDDARIAANLERRQIGMQFKIIDSARLPELPIARGAHKMTLIGGGIGLLAGLGIAFRRPRRRA